MTTTITEQRKVPIICLPALILVKARVARKELITTLRKKYQIPSSTTIKIHDIIWPPDGVGVGPKAIKKVTSAISAYIQSTLAKLLWN